MGLEFKGTPNLEIPASSTGDCFSRGESMAYGTGDLAFPQRRIEALATRGYGRNAQADGGNGSSSLV